MKKLLKILVFVIVLASIAFGIKTFLLSNHDTTKLGPFISVKVKIDTISTTISATGTLEPLDKVEVGTQVSGDISKILVDFNAKVSKGQVIAELDKSKLQATLDKALIAFKSAQNDFKFKQSVYERTKKLAENNSASVVDLEQAEYNMTTAQLAMERSKNDVQEARLNLSYATIKSPIDGVILERAVDVGQTVAASMSTPTLFVIAKDLVQMKVMAAVDEADIGQVKAGQRVDFTVDAFEKDSFQGRVQEVRLNPTTTSNVVTYTVVITADNPEQKLLPGMTAICNIVTQEIPDAILIPIKALKFSPVQLISQGPNAFASIENSDSKKKRPKIKGDKVWVNINGKSIPTPIKTGISDGVNVQILKGLNVGDSVIVNQEILSDKNLKNNEATSPFMPGPPRKKKN